MVVKMGARRLGLLGRIVVIHLPQSVDSRASAAIPYAEPRVLSTSREWLVRATNGVRGADCAHYALPRESLPLEKLRGARGPFLIVVVIDLR